MNRSMNRDAHDEVWEAVTSINRAWLDGNTEGLRQLFHEHVVIAPIPDCQRVRGIEACIASYQDFLSRSTIHHFVESRPSIDVFGNTAITSYSFEITWESSGQTYHEEGQEVLVLVRQGPSWLVVWRTVISVPQQN